jgi:hypothetical protein
VQIVLFGFVPLVVTCFFRFRPVLTALLIAYVFSQILQLFSYIYWTYGTKQNFSVHLSHLDSLYLALGTLTTGGTGNVAAISETARRIQMLEMFLGLAVLAFAVTLVVSRYSTHFERRAAQLAAPSHASHGCPICDAEEKMKESNGYGNYARRRGRVRSGGQVGVSQGRT